MGHRAAIAAPVYGAKPPIQQSPVRFYPLPHLYSIGYCFTLTMLIHPGGLAPKASAGAIDGAAICHYLTPSFWQREIEPAAGSGGDCAEESEIGGDGERRGVCLG